MLVKSDFPELSPQVWDSLWWWSWPASPTWVDRLAQHEPKQVLWVRLIFHFLYQVPNTGSNIHLATLHHVPCLQSDVWVNEKLPAKESSPWLVLSMRHCKRGTERYEYTGPQKGNNRDVWLGSRSPSSYPRLSGKGCHQQCAGKCLQVDLLNYSGI